MATSLVTLQDKIFKQLGVDTMASGPVKRQHPYARRSKLSGRREKRKSNKAQEKPQSSTLKRKREGPLAFSRYTDKTGFTISPKKRGREVEQSANSDSGHDSSWPQEFNENDPKKRVARIDIKSSHVDNVPDINPDRTDERYVLTDQTLSKEDAMIVELERKLGLTKKQKRPSARFPLDGLDDLLNDSSDEGDDEDDDDKHLTAGPSEYAQWLAEKRNGGRGALGSSHAHVHPDDDYNGYVDGDEYPENGFAGKDDILDIGSPISGRAFNDLPKTSSVSRRRENPYKAPVSDDAIKYVPPSRRQTVQDGDNPRLRRQLQGLFNRLTEDNVLSIVYSIDHIYQTNPRGDVTSVLVDIVKAQVRKPELLPDPFFVLIGGFISAIYKIIGASFGSVVLRETVVDFKTEYDRVSQRQTQVTDWNKEASNLLAFITSLYVFDVVGQGLLFDCLDLLLKELSELNAELTLRIIRIAGRLLRKDDPNTFRDTVASINKSVTEAGGHANLPARTKYMVEAINDLKANKARATGGESEQVSGRIRRMNKRLGDVKSQSRRRLNGTTAMGVSLNDIEDADITGKWWLVGASVPAKADDRLKRTMEVQVLSSGNLSDDSVSESDLEEDMDRVVPDYPRLAREQGLATNVQISIFTALMSAGDANHGYQQVMALKLSSSERREIARVLVECVGSEATYNPYYATVAKLAGSCNSSVRFAFQDRLWAFFRQMGEPLFGEDDDGDEEYSAFQEDKRRISHIGVFFGALISNATLSITILRPLDLCHLLSPTQTLIEHMIITIIQECVKSPSSKRESFLRQIFDVTAAHLALVDGICHILSHPRHQLVAMQKKQTADMAVTLTMALEVLRSKERG